jgi:hypothetical protein
LTSVVNFKGFIEQLKLKEMYAREIEQRDSFARNVVK